MTNLHTGFKGSSCPITHERTLNATRDFKGYHLSYNPSSADYGTDTTAIVLKGRVFLVLNGDHRQALSDAAEGVH